VEQLLDLLRAQLHVESESAAALRKVACGFLFNLTNTHGMCSATIPSCTYFAFSLLYYVSVLAY
jgi:hypothetical protein